PDGDSVLFTLSKGTGAAWDKAQIVVQSLKSGRTALLQGGSDARFVRDGHIVYTSGTNLLAVPFDVKNMRIIGGAVPVVERVMKFAPPGSGAAFFAFSGNGTLVSIPDSQQAQGSRALAIADKTGAQKYLPLPPDRYLFARVSPNGTQVAMSIDDRAG